MVQFDDGAWYCPSHGLLIAARTLVALYQVEGDADKVEATESGVGRLDPAPRQP